MKYYSLRISNSDSAKNKISKILGIQSNMNSNAWGYEIIEKENDASFDFVSYFIPILESKIDALYRLGIEKEHITLWLIYEYKHQCDLEFQPAELRRIGEFGISFCISCYSI